MQRYSSKAICAALTLVVAAAMGCGEAKQVGAEGLEAMGLEEADLSRIVEQGDVAQMERLLDQYPDLIEWRNDNEETLLHLAAYARQTRMIELLLNRGADPHARCSMDDTPWMVFR